MATTPDSESRWSAAAQVAAGTPDEGLPRRRRIALIWITAVSVGPVIVGSLLGTWLVTSGGVETAGTDQTTEARLALQLVILGAGVTVGIGGFIWGIGTRRYVTR